LSAFYDRLLAQLRAQGHSLEIFPDTQLPPPDPATITLGYHSRGRRPRTRHLKQSYLRGYLYFDRDGYSGWAEMARAPALFQASQRQDADVAQAFVARMRADYFDRGLSKLPQPQRAYADDGVPYVLLPLQVADDAVLAHARLEIGQLVRQAAAVLAGSGSRLVIKRHPACRSPEIFKLLAELARQPHVRVTDAAIGGLLAGARAVLCVNSGVGFEALFYGKPVFTAGASDYEWVTTPIRATADLAGLADPDRPDPARVARFLHCYCRHYLLAMDDEFALQRRLAALVAEPPGQITQE
jgi:hypothetical protein